MQESSDCDEAQWRTLSSEDLFEEDCSSEMSLAHSPTSEVSSTEPAECRNLDYCKSRIQEVLDALTESLPEQTPTCVVRNMLGYIVHTKWRWAVKFCLKASGTWDRLLPAPWIEDVLVVYRHTLPLSFTSIRLLPKSFLFHRFLFSEYCHAKHPFH